MSWPDLKPNEWINLAAIALGPILAVQVSEWLSKRRHLRERQLHVFRALMASRAEGSLSATHVESLNLIDVEFYKNKRVVLAWKEYLDHLNDRSVVPPDKAWRDKRADLLTQLLGHMGESLGYTFDKIHIKNQVYYPQSSVESETYQFNLRKGVQGLVNGTHAIPIYLLQPPNQLPPKDLENSKEAEASIETPKRS